MAAHPFLRSVRGKLLLAAGATTLLALLIAGTALVTYDLRTYEQSRIEELDTLADALAAAAGPALAFQDRQDAEAALATLRVRPTILAGALLTREGQPFAAYSPAALGPPELIERARGGYAIGRDRVALVKPVLEKGERVGTLHLVAKYEAAQRLRDTATIVALVLAFSLACALAASIWLQRTFTRPLLDIADASRRLIEQRDFSVRVRKTTQDEVGNLVDSFNAMVDELGRRSVQLTEANQGLMREIAERRAAEDARQESEDRFRELADHAPVLIWMNDQRGCIFVNREYLDYSGRTQAELFGAGWLELLHPDDVETTKAEYAAAVEQRGQFEIEHRLRRADGRYRWFKSISVPRFRTDGGLVHYVGCSFDITEIKDYITELDVAEQALREADRRKDEFLAVLSHELRNPLNPIRNAGAILKLGPDAAEIAWAADVIDRQSKQLSRLLEDLMDAARITQGKLELRKQRVNLSSIVDTAVETARGLFQASRQQLDIDLPVEEIQLDADPSRMAQVLGNILGNSSKYTPEGGKIRLSAERRGARVEISVQDTGSGIAPEDLPRVFDLFMQSRVHARHAAGGLGIGLALVKVLVEMHDGTVEARSAGAGKGSEFVVSLPAMAEARPDIASPSSPFAAAARSLRVLIADDIADSADTLAMLLRALKHEVHVAHDGPEALEMARSLRPDAAILDIGMPGLTGHEVAARIRRQDWGKKMTLIALTGWGQQHDIALSRQAGFDHHMTKPADASVLATYLAQTAGTPRATKAH